MRWQGLNSLLSCQAPQLWNYGESKKGDSKEGDENSRKRLLKSQRITKNNGFSIKNHTGISDSFPDAKVGHHRWSGQTLHESLNIFLADRSSR